MLGFKNETDLNRWGSALYVAGVAGGYTNASAVQSTGKYKLTSVRRRDRYIEVVIYIYVLYRRMRLENSLDGSNYMYLHSHLSYLGDGYLY